MSLRRHACLVIALALVSAACSGSAEGEGDASPGTSTTPSTLPGSLHDTVPAPEPIGSSTTTDGPRGGTGAGPTTTGRGASGTTSTVGSGSKPFATTSTPTTVPPSLPPEKCPEPKTCRRYHFVNGQVRRWKIGSDGRATVRYRINPSGAASTITPEQIEGAVKAAMETWERAAPTVRFVYEGRTDKLAVSDDGASVVSFNAPENARTWTTLDGNGDVVEFDIYFRSGGWVWAPCAQRDGSCTPYRTRPDPVTGFYAVDLQAIATHEIGHALRLDDMFDYDQDRFLTMWPGGGGDFRSRHWTTLALGDVLGIRALYPCSCPLPPIYDP